MKEPRLLFLQPLTVSVGVAAILGLSSENKYGHEQAHFLDEAMSDR